MPPVVKSLLLLNVAAFIIDSIIPLSGFLGLWYWGTGMFQPYQLFTYMFMHGGFSHLFFNMFALWMFGRIMEQVWGSQRFLVYYVVCGIGAGLVQELGQMTGIIAANAMTIGASGAVYGILLAFGMTFPNEELFIIPIPIPIKAKWFVCLYAAIEIFEGLSGRDGVAHFAHLGGMFFGLMLILYWRGVTRRKRVEFGGNFWKKPTAQPNMHVSYNDNYSKDYKHGKDYEYNARKKARNEEIDRILDKVRHGGYQCLTESEKQTLFDASNR